MAKDTKFKPGVVQNPKGRPKGARNKAHKALSDAVNEHLPQIIDKIVEKAIEGDKSMIEFIDIYLKPRILPGEYLPGKIKLKGDARARIKQLNEMLNDREITTGDHRQMMESIAKEVEILDIPQIQKDLAELKAKGI